MGTDWTSQGQGAKSHDLALERLGQLVRSPTQDPNSLGSIPYRVADNHNHGKLTITYMLSSFTGLGFSLTIVHPPLLLHDQDETR